VRDNSRAVDEAHVLCGQGNCIKKEYAMKIPMIMNRLSFFIVVLSSALVCAGDIDGLWQTNSESEWEMRLEILKNGTGKVHWREVNTEDGSTNCSTAVLQWKKIGDSLKISSSVEACTYKIGMTYDIADTVLLTLTPVGSSESNTELFYKFYKFGILSSFKNKWDSLSCSQKSRK
jgi:hypothetical protein